MAQKGILSRFLANGFTQSAKRYYSDGELVEVLPHIGDKDRPKDKMGKVENLLHGWETHGINPDRNWKPPVYALEIHANNDKGCSFKGAGTYIFVPEEKKDLVKLPIASLYAKPVVYDDEEDPLKILSAEYCDDRGYIRDNALFMYELSLTNDDYLPIRVWDTKGSGTSEPMQDFLGIFEHLQPDQFVGMSLTVVSPIPVGPNKPDWRPPGKMKIREMTDPDYKADIGAFDRIGRMFRGEESPEEQAERLAGYKKQALDPFEKAKHDAILQKIQSNAFRCTLRTYASHQELLDKFTNLLIQNYMSNYNSFEIVNKHPSLFNAALRREGSDPFMLSPDEIATLWYVADEATAAESVVKSLHRPLPSMTSVPDGLLTFKKGDRLGDIDLMFRNLANS